MLWIGGIIGTGILAWNLTEPKNFIEAIGFLIAWAALEWIAFMITGFILNNGSKKKRIT